MTKIVFVSNYAPHYRVKLFEYLHQKLDIQFYFYSRGEEWYWQKEHGVYSGNFPHKYLSGFRIGNTIIAFSLVKELLLNHYDIYIKCITGRFALPVTYLIARIKKKPFILWTGVWTRIQTPFHRLFFPVTRYIYTYSDAIVVYGNHVKDFLIDLGVKGDKIFLAPQAVDNNFYSTEISVFQKMDLRKSLEIPENKKIVLYLGRLVEIKALPLLIEAFSRINNLEEAVLLIAGSGDQENKLKALVAKLGITNNVRFAGYIKTNETVPYYSIAWVSVLNSVSLPREKETWGNTINESFNQGVPVIATNAVGAVADGFVKNNYNGLVIHENNIEELSSAIDKIISDEELRNRLGKNAKGCVKSQNYKKMASGFLQAIEYVQARTNK